MTTKIETYQQEQEARLREPMREYQFKALLKIYIALGDLVDIKRVGREEPRNYIENLLELSGIDDFSYWDWYLDHEGTWKEFIEAYC